jgi:hypothetical protein
MATSGFLRVIYIIIASQMKTSHTISANSTSNRIARVQSFMVIAGVMIAIICSLVLLKDAYSIQRTEASQSPLVDTAKVAITSQIVKVKEASMLSIIALLK